MRTARARPTEKKHEPTTIEAASSRKGAPGAHSRRLSVGHLKLEPTAVRRQ